MKNSLIVFMAVVMFLFIGNNYSCQQKGNKFTLIFDRADGLEEGALVKIKGLEHGKVTGINLASDSIAVDIRVSRKMQLSSDSKPFIISSITGLTYVALEPGRSQILLRPGDTIRSGFYKEIKLLDNLFSDTGNVLMLKQAIDGLTNSLTEFQKKQKTADSLSLILEERK
jgi:ABC-type transporter Mla subunit MlaD